MTSLLSIFFSFLLLSPSLFAEFKTEIDVIEELVTATEKNLLFQKELLQSMQTFQRAREAFTKDPTSARLATILVKSATRLTRKIEEEHVAHLLSPEFLTEIQFFTLVGKEQLPRSARE
ncbi:MAG: hypothetical protein K940chlam9_01390 [Chlamydiae bacterium]|nr:hypothetical protein [Chlamydiota bacterium]